MPEGRSSVPLEQTAAYTVPTRLTSGQPRYESTLRRFDPGIVAVENHATKPGKIAPQTRLGAVDGIDLVSKLSLREQFCLSHKGIWHGVRNVGVVEVDSLNRSYSI